MNMYGFVHIMNVCMHDTCIYVCIVDIYVPQEVKKSTCISQKRDRCEYPNEKWYYVLQTALKHTIPHARHPPL